MTRQTSTCLIACLAVMSVVFYSYNTAVRGEETPPAALKEDDDIFKDQIVVLEFSAADAAGDLARGGRTSGPGFS